MIRITVSTDNAAFDGLGYAAEASRVLRELADKVEDGYRSATVADANGDDCATLETLDLDDSRAEYVYGQVREAERGHLNPPRVKVSFGDKETHWLSLDRLEWADLRQMLTGQA